MTEEELKHIFAENLKLLLQNGDYTQERFINLFNKKYDTHFNRVSVSDWVTEKRMPRPIIVKQIGEFFGKDASYMLSSTPYVDSIRTTVEPTETEFEKTVRLAQSDQQMAALRVLKLNPHQLKLLNQYLDALVD